MINSLNPGFQCAFFWMDWYGDYLDDLAMYCMGGEL